MKKKRNAAISKLKINEKKRIIRHEVGHWIVAKVLNFNPSIIKLSSRDGGGTDLCLIRSINTTEEVVMYLEERIQVLYAGCLSEKSYGDEPLTVKQQKAAANTWNSTSKDDATKAQQILPIIRNIKFPSTSDQETANKELRDLGEELWKSTVKIIDSKRQEINYLAIKIFNVWKSDDQVIPEKQLNAWYENVDSNSGDIE